VRIVVTGYAATFPYGGVFWDYLQYVLGFHRLGHDALYLEDTGKWCYLPEAGTFVETGHDNAKRLSENIRRYMPELNERWSFRDGNDNVFGMPGEKAIEFCRTADLFIHLSASCVMRDEYFEAKRVAFVDSDPMYTQAKLAPASDPDSPNHASALEHVAWLRKHDVFLSFGENVGKPDCLIPHELIPWRPTRQPITIDRFAPHVVPISQRRPVLNTVASWNPHEVSVQIGGKTYGGKSMEFERFIDLPAKLKLPIELAISGAVPRDRLTAHGWNPIDALAVSSEPGVYRDYIATATAEFSVAKHAYVASNSGWFSCRTACYLALGVPAVVQDTGFTRYIPSGAGVFAFSNEQQAVAGVEAIISDPAVQADAALEIAQEYFDAGKVLKQFIDTAMREDTSDVMTRTKPMMKGGAG